MRLPNTLYIVVDHDGQTHLYIFIQYVDRILNSFHTVNLDCEILVSMVVM